MPEQLTPPVHPNCRCALIDGVWYDAQDARVCPICMLLGASWNLQLDIPMDDKEVARILDEKDLENFRKAIEKDTGLRERVIEQAIRAADSGVAKFAVPQAGESMQIAVEREIVKARAAARAAAPIQAGRVVPGLGVTPDALVFETTPVGKVARLVSVNVASGQSYRVIWRNGVYLLQTTGGRTLDSDTDLWWLLLILALLEKKRRDDLERKRQEELARTMGAR